MRRFVVIALFLASAQGAACAAEPPKCEAGLKAEYRELLPLTPPRTEYVPRGFAVVEFTVNPSGAVSEVSFSEWKIPPSDSFMADYLVRSVQAWRFSPRENACREQQKLTFQLNADA
jgi:hypothetical protein